MKTILEIQNLDRQIRALNREVEKCPASILRLKENAILYLDKDSSAFL